MVATFYQAVSNKSCKSWGKYSFKHYLWGDEVSFSCQHHELGNRDKETYVSTCSYNTYDVLIQSQRFSQSEVRRRVSGCASGSEQTALSSIDACIVLRRVSSLLFFLNLSCHDVFIFYYIPSRLVTSLILTLDFISSSNGSHTLLSFSTGFRKRVTPSVGIRKHCFKSWTPTGWQHSYVFTPLSGSQARPEVALIPRCSFKARSFSKTAGCVPHSSNLTKPT